MSKSVKEQAARIVHKWRTGCASDVCPMSVDDLKAADEIAAAGLLNDERAQACVEACKAVRMCAPRSVGDPYRRVWDAGAAYDEPKVRTQAEIVAELVERWGRDRSRISPLLDELAASVKGEKP